MMRALRAFGFKEKFKKNCASAGTVINYARIPEHEKKKINKSFLKKISSPTPQMLSLQKKTFKK